MYQQSWCAQARRLSVEDDMQPVVAVLQQLGLSRPDICKVLVSINVRMVEPCRH